MNDKSKTGGGAGLLGKLLLPGFTDAGANENFKKPAAPSTNLPQVETTESPTAEASQDGDGDSDEGLMDTIDMNEEDITSEAATELYDNRHPALKKSNPNVPSIRQLASSAPRATPQSPKQQPLSGGNRGFFPSTTPIRKDPPLFFSSNGGDGRSSNSSSPPRQRSSQNTDGSSFEQQKQQPADPPSPPSVTRQQLPISGPIAEGTSDESTSSSGSGISASIRWKARALELQQQTATSEDDDRHSSTTEGTDARNSSLLEESSSSSSNNDDDDNDSTGAAYSDVNSNASEMGTVINLSSSAARMAEVEAMAALIEASPSVFDEGYDPSKPKPEHNTAIDEGLELPVLEEEDGTSRDEANLSTDDNNMNVTPQEQNDMNMSTIATPGIKGPRHMSTQNSSNINYSKASRTLKDLGIHRNLTQTTKAASSSGFDSERLSAAIRRIGSGLHSKNDNGTTTTSKTISAPTTPKTNYLLQRESYRDSMEPPSVQELLQSSVPSTPDRTQPPASFALRSPGSAAKMRHIQSAQDQTSRSRATLMPRFSRGWRPTLLQHDEHGSTSPSVLPGPFGVLTQRCLSLDDYEPSTALEYPPMRMRTTSRYMDQPLDDNEGRVSSSVPSIQHSQSWDVASGMHDHESSNSTSLFGGALPARRRIYSEASSPPRHAQPKILGRAQRLDMEREDALDILACLVQRGVSMQSEEDDSPKEEKREDTSGGEFDHLIEKIQATIKESSDDEGRAQSLATLDELRRSHAYASEMKRAAKSASTWLHSIGRDQTRKTTTGSNSDFGTSVAETQMGNDRDGTVNLPPDQHADSDPIQIVTLQAMLHTTQMQLQEKSHLLENMDKELSECRAEIGRLKSETRSRGRDKHLLLTPNRSILDGTDEDTATPNTSTDNADRGDVPSPVQQEGSCVDISGHGSVLDDSMFKMSDTGAAMERQKEADQLDLLMLKAALEAANTQIRQMHHDLTKGKAESGPPPIVDLPDLNNADLRKDTSTEEQMVNVRMLDGENFVTEWDYLTPPLPPPPDHGLRSPIVSAVLEQWTADEALHQSLTAWIDRVLDGGDLDSIPPLTLSNLDHQVRDGFTMHVLPLILRRADIHVTVHTRAHRKTTYDLAVSVNRKSKQIYDQHQDPPKVLKSSSTEGASVAHSAVTAPVANTVHASPIYYANDGDAAIENAEDTLASASKELEEQNQQGIMTALGGALGGLLRRNNGKNASSSPSRYQDPAAAAALRAQLDLTSSPVPSSVYREDDNEPYHRVVSAPPGRIGITFVEFRGHAMISEVSPNSPLSGWVFPSDILVAIDELPVSGMRIRDIIKELTDRKDKQRALRVISSHAMNEFTMNASAMNEGE